MFVLLTHQNSWNGGRVLLLLRRFPNLLFWRETYPQTFSSEFLLICEYNSWKKPASYRPFKNGRFVRVCMENMMDHQYGENGARYIYSNYKQMRDYLECSPNQPKQLYLIDFSIEQSTKLWRFRKSAGRFCTWILSEYCSSALWQRWASLIVKIWVIT